MRLLLAHGADVNLSNKAGEFALHRAARGCTALHEAICYKHLPVVKLPLENGADAVLNSMQCENLDIDSAISALMLCEDTAILKLLLAAGADVHAVTSSGST
eukprot:17024-Heterococcus_DN1.PRE.5